MSFNDVFNDENNSPSADWFSFDKVGDKVAGELVGVTFKEGTGPYPDQKVYTLKTDEGTSVNVGISMKKDFVHNALASAEPGDTVGFLYESDYLSEEMKKKGLNAAKTIKPFLKKVEKEDIAF